MQRLLSNGLWRELATRALKAKSRRAAIAYATVDHLSLGSGDELVVDASDKAIRSGETSAKLLVELLRKGVELYSHPRLHAKVILLDGVAFIGSANLSASSATHLTEAGILTNHPQTVAAVQAQLAQWVQNARPLTPRELDRLLQLPVSPRRGPAMATGPRPPKAQALGERVWIIGVREISDHAHLGEREAIAKGEVRAEALRCHRGDDLSWIRWAPDDDVAKLCRAGDVIFQVWRSRSGKRLRVLRPATVVLVNKESTCKRIYIEDIPGRMPDELTLLRFQKLLAQLGVRQRVGPASKRALAAHVASQVLVAWKKWQR
ncbi:MAG: phospholipase D family protein [Steroidobacteraceae bacterium]